VGYTIALVIIAGLSIASHTVLEYSLQTDEGSAAVINKSGRQRMLSQRIASLAAQYKSGDVSVRDDLRSAVSEFESAHDFLVSASRAGKLTDANAQELQALYFGSDNSLDAQVRSFVADARQIPDLPLDDPRLDQILPRIFAEARTPLLTALDTVVTIEQRRSEQRVMDLERLQWAILATVLATLLIEAIVIFRPMIRGIIEYTAELLRLATTDPLTGASNRRSFMERCQAEVARARRYNRATSVLMIDVDHFKSVNDTYGHAAGDEVLSAVGDALRLSLRQIDIWGRLGGEEFAVLLVETPLSGAAIVAERIREWFAAMTVQCGGQAIKFTVSIGCTALKQEDRGIEDALRVADQLMYQAKQTGRNRVVLGTVVETG
jgi:diguanylate cyclase (GGDEF)-like protein